jgi:hypothetical protein
MLRMLLQRPWRCTCWRPAPASRASVTKPARRSGWRGCRRGRRRLLSLDDLGGAVSSERFEAVKHTVEADEHRVVVGEVSMGARASRSAAVKPRRVRRWVESVGMLIVVMMFSRLVGLLAAACSQTRMLRNADLC